MDLFYVLYFDGMTAIERAASMSEAAVRADAELWIGPVDATEASRYAHSVPLSDPAWKYGEKPLFYLFDNDYQDIVAAHDGQSPPAGRGEARPARQPA